MSSPIADCLALRPLVVLDGALATELERRGADLRDPLWSAKYLLEQPQMIRAVHLDYFRAGADVATTATYQATFEGFARRGIAHEEAAQLMREAVALAASARDEFWSAPANRAARLRPLIAASVGPYGAMLGDGAEYRGHYAVSDSALAAFHRPRLEVLAQSGADLLACETIPCLREALVLARLLDGFSVDHGVDQLFLPGRCAQLRGRRDRALRSRAAGVSSSGRCRRELHLARICRRPFAAHARAHRQTPARLSEFRGAIRGAHQTLERIADRDTVQRDGPHLVSSGRSADRRLLPHDAR